MNELHAAILQACSEESAARGDGEGVDIVLEDKRSGFTAVSGEDDEAIVYGSHYLE